MLVRGIVRYRVGVIFVLCCFLMGYRVGFSGDIKWTNDAGKNSISWGDARNWMDDSGQQRLPVTGDEIYIYGTDVSNSLHCIYYDVDTDYSYDLLKVWADGIPGDGLLFSLKPGTSSLTRVLKAKHIRFFGDGNDMIKVYVGHNSLLRGTCLINMRGFGQMVQSGGDVEGGVLSLEGKYGKYVRYYLNKGKVKVAKLKVVSADKDSSSSFYHGSEVMPPTNAYVGASSVVIGGLDTENQSGWYEMYYGTLDAGSIYLQGENAGFVLHNGDVEATNLYIGYGDVSSPIVSGGSLFSIKGGHLKTTGDVFLGSYTGNLSSAYILQTGNKMKVHSVGKSLWIGAVGQYRGAAKSKYQVTNGELLVGKDVNINSVLGTISSLLVSGKSKLTVGGDLNICGSGASYEQWDAVAKIFGDIDVSSGGKFTIHSGNVLLDKDSQVSIDASSIGKLETDKANLKGGKLVNSGGFYLDGLMVNMDVINYGRFYANYVGWGKDRKFENGGWLWIGQEGFSDTAWQFLWQGDFYNGDSGRIFFSFSNGGYDSLYVEGKIELGGYVSISVLPGWNFSVVDVFDLIYSDKGLSILANFSINLPDIGSDKYLDWGYDMNRLYLEVKSNNNPSSPNVVPEPSSVLMFLGGILFINRRRKGSAVR